MKAGEIQNKLRRLPALFHRWEEGESSLPVRLIRSPYHGPPGPLRAAPPWLATGVPGQPFDFCGNVRRLLADMAARCPCLGHVDVSRILLGVTRCRNRRVHGLQARLTPLRFHGGVLRRRRRGITYQVQRYFVGKQEFLYLLTFSLPRFLDQDFSDKFITLFHELYHIHPDGNGDLRRHQGRYSLHSYSQKHYDRHMAQLAREYLAGKPDPELHAFLRLDFAQLQERHGAVAGLVVPRPRIVAVADGIPG